MIGFLRRMFGGGGAGSPQANAAPLNHALLLVLGGRKVAGGALRARATFGRWPRRRRVSVWEFRSGETDATLSTGGLGELVDDFSEGISADARGEVFDFILANTLKDLDEPGAYALAKSLHLLRERLRKPLPWRGEAEFGEPIHVDLITMVDERSVWVRGWSGGDNEVLARVELITPEGHSAGTLENSYRFSRPDVEQDLSAMGIMDETKHGYTKYLELPAPSHLSAGWLAEIRGPSGSGCQWVLPTATDPTTAREIILADVAWERPGIEKLRRDYAYPALDRLQTHLEKSIQIDTVVQYGEPPPSPDVSIVVPLYERIEFVEHQIVQFWQDPEIAAAELIYVLDTPKLAPALAAQAGELHALYGLPFKVVTLNRNAGFAAANSLGVSQARGRLLLLLNSDVLPDEPGWLGRMRSFYDATAGIGALGPKLLYEDDSLQHAGMYFVRDAPTGWLVNQHYHKGLSRSLPAANVNRPVPAVTGACLMIDKKLFDDIGGFSTSYVQGGFEDSDLCLKLIEAGRENWYVADVELYHLEAQSFPIHLRTTNPYNAWLQTHLWGERIEQVMKQFEDVDTHLVAVH